jgi:hypothetical protein
MKNNIFPTLTTGLNVIKLFFFFFSFKKRKSFGHYKVFQASEKFYGEVTRINPP